MYTQDIPGQAYLVRKAVCFLPDDSILRNTEATSNNDNNDSDEDIWEFHARFQKDPYEAPSVAERPFITEHHILWSMSYGVPVLFFNGWKSGNSTRCYHRISFLATWRYFQIVWIYMFSFKYLILCCGQLIPSFVCFVRKVHSMRLGWPYLTGNGRPNEIYTAISLFVRNYGFARLCAPLVRRRPIHMHNISGLCKSCCPIERYLSSVLICFKRKIWVEHGKIL